MAEYEITESEVWNPDEILEATTSIKDLLTYEFNEENDNIDRNLRILELIFVKVSKIEAVLKKQGLM